MPACGGESPADNSTTVAFGSGSPLATPPSPSSSGSNMIHCFVLFCSEYAYADHFRVFLYRITRRSVCGRLQCRSQSMSVRQSYQVSVP